MSVTGDLQTFLLSKTAITNIVGTAGVYVTRAPQGVDFPYITIQLISTDRATTRTNDGDGLPIRRYQIDCWHKGSADIYTLAEAVRTSLSNYDGTMTSTTVQKCEVNDDMEFAETPEFGGEQTVDRIMMEAELWVTESIPN